MSGRWQQAHGTDGVTAVAGEDFAVLEGAACKLAAFAHHGQVDKLGVDYIEHPAAVVALLRSSRLFDELSSAQQQVAVLACWLHDVVEDTQVTEEDLLRFGFSRAVVDVVLLLTRRNDVSSEDYYAAIRSDPVARACKVADMGHNLSPERTAALDGETRMRLTEKYRKATVALGAEGLVPGTSG